MHADPIVQRRFEELGVAAEKIIGNRYDKYRPMPGDYVVSVDVVEGRKWIVNSQNLIQRVFGVGSVHLDHFVRASGKFGGRLDSFEEAYGIFRASREDYEGGYLFNLRTLATAEVLSDALDQAKQLLESGYKDPACILLRVSLEVALKDLAQRFHTGPAKLDKMNADLTKAGAYNGLKAKQITAWADLGNKAAHGEWGAYSDKDVEMMLHGVEDFVGAL